MNTEMSDSLPPVYNLIEQDVLHELRQLPSGFQLIEQPQPVRFEEEGVSYRYEPDFIVSSPDGRRMIVEVKSHHSLSMANMATLAAISEHTRKVGDKFLLLVPDATAMQASKKLLPESFGLNIAFTDRSNVVHSVVQALEPVRVSVSAP